MHRGMHEYLAASTIKNYLIHDTLIATQGAIADWTIDHLASLAFVAYRIGTNSEGHGYLVPRLVLGEMSLKLASHDENP